MVMALALALALRIGLLGWALVGHCDRWLAACGFLFSASGRIFYCEDRTAMLA